MGYSEKPSLDELAHYGVRGMKWGVRRGGLGARFKGALSDRNQQQTAILTRMKEGRGKGLDEKLGAAISTAANLGRNRRNKVIDKQLGKLEDQKRRIESGKLKARDILESLATTSVLDLAVSRRDNRG